MPLAHVDPGASGMPKENLIELARGTWKVCGTGVSTAPAKSAYCSLSPSRVRKLAPHFLTNPASAIARSTPSATNTSLLQGSCDSPMWKRGKWSRSRRSTDRPFRARAVAALEPPGPPPTTTMSNSQSLGVVMVADRMSRRADGYCARLAIDCSYWHVPKGGVSEDAALRDPLDSLSKTSFV